MPSTSDLLVFSAAALALLVVPGPAVTYIVTRSAADGRRAGLVSVVGIHTGTLVHVAAAAAGLSALLMASAVAFTAVKLAGGAYLIVLGVRTIRGAGRRGSGDEPVVVARSLRRTFSQGFVVNLLNPKTALFFLAFLPQFVSPASSAPVQILVFGLVFVLLGLVSDGAYALGGAWVASRLGPGSRRRTGGVVAGSIYIALGVTAAFGGHSS